MSLTPSLSWASAPTATTYSVVVANNAAYTSPVVNTTGITGTSYNVSTALNNSATYYWKVTAVNAAGSTVATNAGISFTTLAAPTAPGNFTQSAPIANATGVSNTPSFSWASASGASSYSLVVSTNSSYTSPIINQTGISGTSYASGTSLAYSTQYYWKVTAVNGVGNKVATNAGISFTTQAAPPAPGAFAQTAPAANATGVATSPSFTWAASIQCIIYTHWLFLHKATIAAPVINQSGISGTSFSGSGLANSTQYYWKVTAVNGVGSTVATNAGLSFTTEAASTPPPTAGVIFEAENLNRANTNVASSQSGYSGSGYLKDFTSEWSYARFEKSYNNITPSVINIRYSNGTGAAVTNIDLKVGNAIIQDLTFPPTSGWGDWQVLQSVAFDVPAGYQGIELDGTDNVSQSVYIDYMELLDGSSVPPGSFTLISPANAATNQSLNVQLSWNASSNASSYAVVVDNNSNFSSPEYSQTVTGTNCNPTGLANSTTYYWKVTAINANGSTPSASRSFTTMAPLPLPGTFSHTAPANAATGVATNVAFSWGASSNAESYSLKVSTASNLSNPIVNATGISGTSYSANLADATTYYWQVTAVNSTGTKQATKTSFTTLVPPPPGSFTLSAPLTNATDVSRFPSYSWSAASNATSYTLGSFCQ